MSSTKLCAFVVLASPFALTAQNLLPNPGFETGVVQVCTQGELPAPWVQASNTNPGADTWAIDCGTMGGVQIDQWGHFPSGFLPHSGQRFATGWSAANEAFATPLNNNVIPGQVYRLSGWFAASLQHGGHSGYDVFLSSSPFRQTGYYLGSIGVSATTGVWTQDSLDFLAPPSVSWLVFDPRTDDNNYLSVDDLDLSLAPTGAGRFVGWGQALAGTHGLPVLRGSGTVAANQNITVAMSGGLENAPCVQVVGFLAGYMPLVGGVLIPNPDVVLFTYTSPTGQASLSLQWPAVAPPFGVFFQYGVFDPMALQGVSMSNALQAVR